MDEAMQQQRLQQLALMAQGQMQPQLKVQYEHARSAGPGQP